MRLIDADALKSYLNENEYADMYYIEALFGIIDRQPIISPDEVRGAGKWEKDSDGLDVCSECGEIALQRVFIKLPDKIVDLQMVRSKFCPNCGARMRGVSEDV